MGCYYYEPGLDQLRLDYCRPSEVASLTNIWTWNCSTGVLSLEKYGLAVVLKCHTSASGASAEQRNDWSLSGGLSVAMLVSPSYTKSMVELPHSFLLHW